MQVIWGGERNPEIRDALVRFASSHVFGGEKSFGNCVAMGVLDGERLIAGMIFHNYAPDYGVIELSGAATSRRWLTRKVFAEMFGYPFDQLGCQMLIARHSEHNTRLRRMWKAVGADEYLIPRLRGRNEAEAVATYTAETWRDGKIMRGLH